MRFSLEWLREFVAVDVSPQELAERLTLAGIEVGSWEQSAPPAGPGGAAGTSAPDTVFEIDITANRPDVMNHLGLAREIAAILGLPLRLPEFSLAEDAAPASGAAHVAIAAGDLCPRYVGRVITGLRVGDSPAWLQRRLAAIGLSPKNNVVDASNYVLFELGQPLHTFDLGRLAGRGVVARRAVAGETIVTVADHEHRTLPAGLLVIAEAGAGGRPGRPAAIAGVMGGLDSAISPATTEILIESAYFDPGAVRRAARTFAIHSDASHRFERGADPGMTLFAADRLAAMIAGLAGGRILRGALDVKAEPGGPRASGSPAGSPATSGHAPSCAQSQTSAQAPAADHAPAFSQAEGFSTGGSGASAPAAPSSQTESSIPAARRFQIHWRERTIVLRTQRLCSLLGIATDPSTIAETLGRLSIVAAPGAAGATDPSGGPDTSSGAAAPRAKDAASLARGSASPADGATSTAKGSASPARDTVSTAKGSASPTAGALGPAPGSTAYRIPSWRGDITREVDLIEEYARLKGYREIPDTLPRIDPPAPAPEEGAAEDRARRFLASYGYREAVTYAMIPAGDDALYGTLAATHDGPSSRLVISNPLSDRWEVMRRSLLPGLARALVFNLARGRMDLRLFEVGSVHQRDGSGHPLELRAAALGASGSAADPAWPQPSRPYDILDLKGVLAALVAGLSDASDLDDAGQQDPDGRLGFSAPELRQDAAGAAVAWPFHPRQSFAVSIGGRRIGRGGRLLPEVEAAMESDRPLYMAELLLEPFLGPRSATAFKALPRLNPVERDLSFLVRRALPFAETEHAVRAAASALGAGPTGSPSCILIDRFEGGSLPKDRVSYAFRFRFTPRERALTAEELNGAVEEIARHLERQVGAEIRSK